MSEPSAESVARIERAMRSFKRIGDARRVQQRIQRLVGSDLDSSSFVALMQVAESGPLRLTDLAESLWLDLSVVSRRVRQLEDLGYVERSADPGDARVARVSISAAGREIAERFAASRTEFLTGLFAEWPEGNREQFAELLEQFVADVVRRYELEESGDAESNSSE